MNAMYQSAPHPCLYESALAMKEQTDPIISVSTTFHPSASLPGSNQITPDLLLLSRDSVYFFVHQATLEAQSSNHFGGLLQSSWSPDDTPSPTSTCFSPQLSSDPWLNKPIPQALPPSSFFKHGVPLSAPFRTPVTMVRVPVSSEVLNVLLHTIYELPCIPFYPTLDALTSALRCLPLYGLARPSPTSDVWTLLIQYAPTEPIRVYSAAASHSMDTVCIAASEYTLQTSLHVLTDGDALTMGSIYLRRLMFLHLGRQQALSRVILNPPQSHSLHLGCGISEQAWIKSRWASAVGAMITKPTAQNTRVEDLAEVFGPIVKEPKCAMCREKIRTRFEEVLRDWTAVRRTI